MSLVKLSGNASGTGALTIAAPNTNTDYTLTLPTQTGILVSGTTTAGVVVPAGTATLAAVLLNSGTNLTSATAGAIEYDGKVVYGTPLGTQRGIVPTQQYYRLNADFVGSNALGAQSMFGVGVTLSASTVYEFELVFGISKSAGTTSHNFGYNFGGTATLNNIGFIVLGASQSSGFGPLSAAANMIGQWSTTAANTNVVSGITSAAFYHLATIKGTVSVNAGGTFIPNYQCSAAPGGAYTTSLGSYIRINPLSASGAATNVGTWA